MPSTKRACPDCHKLPKVYKVSPGLQAGQCARSNASSNVQRRTPAIVLAPPSLSTEPGFVLETEVSLQKRYFGVPLLGSRGGVDNPDNATLTLTSRRRCCCQDLRTRVSPSLSASLSPFLLDFQVSSPPRAKYYYHQALSTGDIHHKCLS